MPENHELKKNNANAGKLPAYFNEATTFSNFFSLCGKKILPALKMAWPSVLLGVVLCVLLFWSGLGDMIGNGLTELTGPALALIIIFAVCLIPSVSPILGPGLFFAIIAGVLTGEQIAAGKAKPILALTSLLAIDAAFGGSFIPPGHILGENEPETIDAGVPGIVFTRLITLPVALVLTCLFSFL